MPIECSVGKENKTPRTLSRSTSGTNSHTDSCRKFVDSTDKVAVSPSIDEFKALKRDNDKLVEHLDSLTTKLTRMEGKKSSAVTRLEEELEAERNSNEILRNERDLLTTELEKATTLFQDQVDTEAEFGVYIRQIKALETEVSDKARVITILEGQLEEMGVSGDLR
jgi:predicted RNase H-like nuclease (RuvC/YqgF family)